MTAQNTQPEILFSQKVIGPGVTAWLPGETLFSACSRHHHVVGNARDSDTCLQLFGHPRTGTAHDMPSRISVFSSRTQGRFGNAPDVIQQHTILPYYLPFRNLKESDDAVASMAGDSRGSLKARLGLAASRFGASHPLKACPTCMQEDASKFGVAYWHTVHQLPGVWICTLHSDLLLASSLKVSGVERFAWLLPNSAQFVPRANAPWTSNSVEVLRTLAIGAEALWSMPLDLKVLPARLAWLYQARLKQLGALTPSGRFVGDSFGELISTISRHLNSISEFASVASAAPELSIQFARVVRSSRYCFHPLRHLIVIAALFDDWDSFFSAYQACEDSVSGGKDQATHPPDTNRSKRYEVLDDLTVGGMSVRAVATKHSLTVATVMVWATEASIAVKRRPKLLFPKVRQRLIDRLMHGADKSDVASELGISIQTVTHAMRTEIGLARIWRDVRRMQRQNSAREALKMSAVSHPTSSIEVLRALQPSSYAWLYRNDRAWLENFVAELPRMKLIPTSFIRWDSRDAELAQAIREAVLNWSLKGTKKKMTIGNLCQLIPDLKKRMSKLDKLPLCRAALSRVSGRKRLGPTLF